MADLRNFFRTIEEKKYYANFRRSSRKFTCHKYNPPIYIIGSPPPVNYGNPYLQYPSNPQRQHNNIINQLNTGSNLVTPQTNASTPVNHKK